jgi:hypothetical protein
MTALSIPMLVFPVMMALSIAMLVFPVMMALSIAMLVFPVMTALGRTYFANLLGLGYFIFTIKQ